jgi:hypothetical protein
MLNLMNFLIKIPLILTKTINEIQLIQIDEGIIA